MMIARIRRLCMLRSLNKLLHSSRAWGICQGRAALALPARLRLAAAGEPA